MTHLIIKKDTDDGGHHSQDVGEGHRVAQHQQWDANDHDPLGGVCNSIAERADEIEDAESNDVLSEVTEPADEQKDEGSGWLWDIRLKEAKRYC